MAKSVRAAVIGCGAIAERLHVPDYATCGQAEVVALCDADEGRAKVVAGKWAPGAKTYTDYTQMLKDAKPDCVTVALPNKFHAPVTIAALEAGCHVMVEKPMAASRDEAEAMVAAAEKAGRLLMVNQTQRLFPAHIRAREVVASGILGKVLTVTAMFGHAGPEHWSPTGTWFFQAADARWGAMADLGVHKADIVRYITGKEVGQISAYTACLEKPNATVEDNFVSCVTFTDGTLGTISASWTVKGMESNYTILHCSNGSLRISEIPGKPLIAGLHNPQCEIEFEVPEGPKRYEGSWGVDASGHFVRAILGEEEPFCTGADAKKSLDIIIAAEESARTGKSVAIAH